MHHGGDRVSDSRLILGKSVDLLIRQGTPWLSSASRSAHVKRTTPLSGQVSQSVQLRRIDNRMGNDTVKVTYEILIAAKKERNIHIEPRDTIIARLKLQVQDY